MKPRSSFLLAACLLLNLTWVGTSLLPAEEPQTPAPARGAVAAPATEGDELEQLVAPIALYPDALVALILPAATESSDIVLAARFLEGGGAATDAQSQPWDASVKSLVHYPDVVKWMDENLEWTRRIGDAYLEKPADVMAAIQRARARAHANGVLVTTPQQRVVVEGDTILIVPAQPEVIYVPRYDPEIIYVHRPFYYPDPWVTFGIGFGVGAWLNYDCDWRRRTIVIDHRHRHHWRDRHDWHHHHFAGRPDRFHGWKPWSPRPDRLHHRRSHFGRHGSGFVRPAPIVGAPHFNGHRDRRPEHFTRRDRDGVEHRGHSQVTRPRDRANSTPSGVVNRARREGEDRNHSINPGIRRPRPTGNDVRREREHRFNQDRVATGVQRGQHAAPPASRANVNTRPAVPNRSAVGNPPAQASQSRPRQFASNAPRQVVPQRHVTAVAPPSPRPVVQAPRPEVRSAPAVRSPERTERATHHRVERSSPSPGADRARVDPGRGRGSGRGGGPDR